MSGCITTEISTVYFNGFAFGLLECKAVPFAPFGFLTFTEHMMLCKLDTFTEEY